MGIIIFIIAVISGSAILTYGVVKVVPKMKKITFPHFLLEKFIPKKFRKKREPRNITDYDLETIIINGEPIPRLVPKKTGEEKSPTLPKFDKNTLVMAGVVVAGALVGYYILKNRRK